MLTFRGFGRGGWRRDYAERNGTRLGVGGEGGREEGEEATSRM